LYSSRDNSYDLAVLGHSINSLYLFSATKEYTMRVYVTLIFTTVKYIPYIHMLRAKMQTYSLNFVGNCPTLLSFRGNFLGKKPTL